MQFSSHRPRLGRPEASRRAPRGLIIVAGLVVAGVAAVPLRQGSDGAPGGGGAFSSLGSSQADGPAGPVTLEALWSAFADEFDPGSASVEDFERWFSEGEGARVAIEISSTGTWATEFTDQAGVVSLRGAPGARGGTWRMEVERAPWTGRLYTLACHDLGCVLCHTRIERDQRPGRAAEPARVASLVPFVEPVGARLSIDGGFEAFEGELIDLAPDLEAWLQGAEPPTGQLAYSFGRAVQPGSSVDATGLGVHALTEGRVDGRHDGHLVLIGTRERPVLLDGDIVVTGDLVLSGIVHGDGQLLTLGSTFLPGDVHHDGPGSLRIASAGSILIGDVTRPRQGESRPVTGGPDGSFSFLIEALARFNGREAASRGGAPAPPFTLGEGVPAPVLFGDRATGDWDDPSLTLVAPSGRGESTCIGPTGAPAWLDLRDLDPRALDWVSGAGTDVGTTIQAALVAGGVCVIVAAEPRDTGDADPLVRGPGPASPPSSVPAGGFRIRGSLVARHVAIHAPAGAWIQDDARARAAQRFPAPRGLVHRMLLTPGPNAGDSNDGDANAGRLPRPVGTPTALSE